ncbi:MAG: hypothetical protein NT169_28445 [Chloroflexi bacterium]|nr:hypothetical protein [Chloroflexota bacterium]
MGAAFAATDGLHISAMSAHRIYDTWGWNKPITVKISHAEAAGLNL